MPRSTVYTIYNIYNMQLKLTKNERCGEILVDDGYQCKSDHSSHSVLVQKIAFSGV